MKAYSLETRQAIVQAIDQRVPRKEIVRQFHVSPSSVTRYVKLQREQGHVQSEFMELDGLTHKQVEAVRLVATGLSNEEIAQHLGISAQTVRNRVHRILTHLGLARRSQIVIFAHQRRLINLDTVELPGGCHE
jgi:DNA-binding NarL/FixJ family response regulator